MKGLIFKKIVGVATLTSITLLTSAFTNHDHDTANHGLKGHHMTSDSSASHHEVLADHSPHGSSLAGMPGEELKADRSIEVDASDDMRFIHSPLKIKTGETIKFVISNKGAINHEFSIGTKSEHMQHGKMMMNMPDMHHGPGGNAVTVLPGETATLTWTFKRAVEVEAACNIPGHYQAGMHSSIALTN